MNIYKQVRRISKFCTERNKTHLGDEEICAKCPYRVMCDLTYEIGKEWYETPSHWDVKKITSCFDKIEKMK